MKKKGSGKEAKAERKIIPEVRGTTSTIKKLLSEKVAVAKILELVVPELTDKKVPLKKAKSRVRGLLYRELKKAKIAKVSKE